MAKYFKAYCTCSHPNSSLRLSIATWKYAPRLVSIPKQVAQDGALFTYEAIPRTTWLWTDVIEDDYRINVDGTSAFPEIHNQCNIKEDGKGQKLYKDNQGIPLGNSEVWKVHSMLLVQV